MNLFFHFRLSSSKVWSTWFLGFIGICENQKLKNNFVVHIILENLERLGNVSTVQGVLAFAVKQNANQIFFKDSFKIMIFTCNKFESESF